MLNSIQLSDRGFGVPEFPVVSDDQSLIVLAWLLRSIQTAEQRLKARETSIAQLEERLSSTVGKEYNRIKRELQALHEKQNKEIAKYNENFSRRFSSFIRDQKQFTLEMQEFYEKSNAVNVKKSTIQRITSKTAKTKAKIELTKEQIAKCEELLSLSNGNPFKFLKLYQDKQRQTFSRIHSLIEFFTERAARQINLTRGDILANAVVEIVRLTTWLEAARRRCNRSSACTEVRATTTSSRRSRGISGALCG